MLQTKVMHQEEGGISQAFGGAHYLLKAIKPPSLSRFFL